MNRRTIVLAIAGAALAVFAIGAYVYTSRSGEAPADIVASPPIGAPLDQPPQSASPPDATAVQQEPAAETAPTPSPQWNAYVREHSPVIGPRDASVTIVEFFDPSCEACRAFYPIVKQIMAQYPNDVRLVLRYTPLHEGSDEAVRILETARMQNVFEPVLEALFVEQPRWAAHGRPQLESAWTAAAAAGLDQGRARTAMRAPHITAALNQDIADATTLGVRGTPTFFVNGKSLPSFGPQQLYDLVRTEVEAVDR